MFFLFFVVLFVFVVFVVLYLVKQHAEVAEVDVFASVFGEATC